MYWAIIKFIFIIRFTNKFISFSNANIEMFINLDLLIRLKEMCIFWEIFSSPFLNSWVSSARTAHTSWGATRVLYCPFSEQQLISEAAYEQFSS